MGAGQNKKIEGPWSKAACTLRKLYSKKHYNRIGHRPRVNPSIPGDKGAWDTTRPYPILPTSRGLMLAQMPRRLKACDDTWGFSVFSGYPPGSNPAGGRSPDARIRSLPCAAHGALDHCPFQERPL